MPGFGHDPFGHYPFGHPPAAGAEVTPSALTATLSIQPGALDGLLEPAASLSLLLISGGDSAITLILSPTPLSALLTGGVPVVTAFSTTRTPDSLVGVLSIPPYTVDFYTDTVVRTPASLIVALSLPAPTVTAVDTQLEPTPLGLTLAIVPPAQPVTFTNIQPSPLTALLGLPARDLPVTAGWVLPGPLTAHLVTGGAPSQALAFVPNSLVLTLVLPRYFVFAGLPYSMSRVQVYEPWDAEPALAEAWQMLTEAGLPWGIRSRATGGWELVIRVTEPWQVRGRNP